MAVLLTTVTTRNCVIGWKTWWCFITALTPCQEPWANPLVPCIYYRWLLNLSPKIRP